MSEPWKLYWGGEETEFPTFKETVEAMMRKVQSEEILTWQFLETAIWIEPMGGGMPPIMFYTARDIASELGWSEEWKLRTAKKLRKKQESLDNRSIMPYPSRSNGFMVEPAKGKRQNDFHDHYNQTTTT